MGEPTLSARARAWLALVGPTCSGKTWFAGELLRRFPLERVNLDSFQVYAHFRVGTGRADLDDGRAHLYGFVDPREPLPPGRYVELAQQAVSEITRAGRHPLFEGGSISYLRELVRAHPVRLLGIRPVEPSESDELVLRRLAAYPIEELAAEVRAGLERGYRDTQVLRDDVVYLPMVEYLEGRADLSQTLARMRRNLAARQQTQMREYEAFDVQWFSPSHDSLPALIHAVAEVLDA